MKPKLKHKKLDLKKRSISILNKKDKEVLFGGNQAYITATQSPPTGQSWALDDGGCTGGLTGGGGNINNTL